MRAAVDAGWRLREVAEVMGLKQGTAVKRVKAASEPHPHPLAGLVVAPSVDDRDLAGLSPCRRKREWQTLGSATVVRYRSEPVPQRRRTRAGFALIQQSRA